VDENKVKRTLRIALRYTSDRRSVITDLKRISRPGCRRYVARPAFAGGRGMGISILSTPGA